MRKLCYFINSDWYFDLHWIDRAIAAQSKARSEDRFANMAEEGWEG